MNRVVAGAEVQDFPAAVVAAGAQEQEILGFVDGVDLLAHISRQVRVVVVVVMAAEVDLAAEVPIPKGVGSALVNLVVVVAEVDWAEEAPIPKGSWSGLVVVVMEVCLAAEFPIVRSVGVGSPGLPLGWGPAFGGVDCCHRVAEAPAPAIQRAAQMPSH